MTTQCLPTATALTISRAMHIIPHILAPPQSTSSDGMDPSRNKTMHLSPLRPLTTSTSASCLIEA